MTGRVVGAGKQLETVVSGGGGVTYNGNGGSAPVQSRTIIHDRLFIMDRSGREHSIELVDWDVACREGHILTVTSLIKKTARCGIYVRVRNETTGAEKVDTKQLKKLCRPSGIAIVAAAFDALFCLAKLGGDAAMAVANFLFWGTLIGGFTYRAIVTRQRLKALLQGQQLLAA